MERLSDPRGQASSEYVALVALVGLMLALAAGLTSGGVGGQVLAGLQRGLCRVADVRCPPVQPAAADLAPCPLERTTSAESLTGALEVVDLGRSGTLSAVRGSDGRVTVTLADGATAGGRAGVGLRLGLGRRVGAEATAGLAASVASGRSWTLPDVATARAFVDRYGAKTTIGGKAVDAVRSGCSVLCDAIGWRPHAELPPPDEAYTSRGGEGHLEASIGAASLQATADGLLGTRRRRDGSSTSFLQFDNRLGAVLDVGVATLGARGNAEVVLSYTVDARGRPAELVLGSVVRAGPDGALRVSRGGHSLGAGAAEVVLTELEAKLNLRDPRNRDAARELMEAMRHPFAAGELSSRLGAVRQRIARTGVVDRRTYALTSTAFSLGATVALGGRLGGMFERTSEEMRLLSAETRLPGLPFLPRDDCRVP